MSIFQFCDSVRRNIFTTGRGAGHARRGSNLFSNSNAGFRQAVKESRPGGSGTIRRVTITGRVQGVGYRAWVVSRARAHNLEGWVRNRRDGSVEALFAGPEHVVAGLIERCRRGPSTSGVNGVESHVADSDELNLRRAGERFSVLPTV